MNAASNDVPKYCETKSILLQVYQKATMAYSDAVLALNPMAVSHAEYNIMFRRAEQAELQAIAGRRELEQHIVEHGC